MITVVVAFITSSRLLSALKSHAKYLDSIKISSDSSDTVWFWLPRRGAGGEVAGEGEEEDCAGDHGDEDGEEEHRQPQRRHAQQPRARALGVRCSVWCLVVYVSTSKVQSKSISH